MSAKGVVGAGDALGVQISRANVRAAGRKRFTRSLSFVPVQATAVIELLLVDQGVLAKSR